MKSTIILILIFIGSLSASNLLAQEGTWVGSWTTSPQLVEPHNIPPSPGLAQNSIRQNVRISVGGQALRLRLSNEFSEGSTELLGATIAVNNGGAMIDTTQLATLLFKGETSITIPAGEAVWSDSVAFTLAPLSTLSITLYIGDTSNSNITGHPGSRTTSYILEGNHMRSQAFEQAVTTDHWYLINTLDVFASDTAASVVIIGDSITDGRGSGTNEQNRWPDHLAEFLQSTQGYDHIGVLNAGIGGNCVLGSCLGPSAINRFNRDVVEQSGARWVIIYEGINDIGYGGPGTGDRLIEAFTQMARTAQSNGLYAYAATIMPFKNSFYYSDAKNTEREKLNQWIRTTEVLDGYIDLDLIIRSTEDTLSMRSDLHDNDWLHPNKQGHEVMGRSVDPTLFDQKEAKEYIDTSTSYYFEAECTELGSDWELIQSSQTSNGFYVTVTPGTQSLSSATSDAHQYLMFHIPVEQAGNYTLYGRMNNEGYDNDSFWVRVNEESFSMQNGLVTSGWAWVSMGSYPLASGDQTLSIAYREDGALLDKIVLTDGASIPIDFGGEAINTCTPTSSEYPDQDHPTEFRLEANYPNPFNPGTTLRFHLGSPTFTTLEIFDILGNRVETLIQQNLSSGMHQIHFDAKHLSSGVYFYQLKTTQGFLDTQQMVLVK